MLLRHIFTFLAGMQFLSILQTITHIDKPPFPWVKVALCALWLSAASIPPSDKTTKPQQ